MTVTPVSEAGGKDLTRKELSDIFSVTCWTGIILSILFFFSSWLIADYYQNSTLRILCQLLGYDYLRKIF